MVGDDEVDDGSIIIGRGSGQRNGGWARTDVHAHTRRPRRPAHSLTYSSVAEEVEAVAATEPLLERSPSFLVFFSFLSSSSSDLGLASVE